MYVSFYSFPAAEQLKRSSSHLPPQQFKVLPNQNATCTVTSATPETLVIPVAQQKTVNASELNQPQYTFQYVCPVDKELNALILQNQDNDFFSNDQLIDPNILQTEPSKTILLFIFIYIKTYPVLFQCIIHQSSPH